MDQGRMQLPDGTVIGYVLMPRRRFFSWTLWTTIVSSKQGVGGTASWNFAFRRSALAKLGRVAGDLIDAADLGKIPLDPMLPERYR